MAADCEDFFFFYFLQTLGFSMGGYFFLVLSLDYTTAFFFFHTALLLLFTFLFFIDIHIFCLRLSYTYTPRRMMFFCISRSVLDQVKEEEAK
ncbi:hypothetical protein QBC42DRAFT_54990 [Cladorrhinum samala]|uniref:Uncharacterized protein n=1 Tax=Cladorrhinum samala TaxID=585594 RepID=A0AAV9H797_9PEZI|nr:hypothetical protein QBC42DRAFT_54990 [Cladorrhinum samala]